MSEAGYVGAAMAAASTGLRPIAELMFNDFIGTCLDQVLNQGAKFRYMFGGKAEVPITIRTTHGAGFRAAAQHSQSLYALFTSIPGLKVVVPSSPYDAKGLLLAAIEDQDPVIFLKTKRFTISQEMFQSDTTRCRLAKSRCEKRRLRCDHFCSRQKQVHTALEAAEQLTARGIEAEVIDPRSLSPLDEEAILTSVKKQIGLSL
ncbi:hypothetical protein BsIDN1_09430 [Bacillus safensis]|uniref:Transketolase-like pyrimidine-binding domain-containing protein n=1 Tax=Bacillus safensis TaxID=561879 RepID=A0A5S9M3H8_BACIA|nr:hypothetical protein BsIDN1_09430 [Bacillus safensis]